MSNKSSVVQMVILFTFLIVSGALFSYAQHKKNTVKKPSIRHIGQVVNEQANADLWEITIDDKWCLISITAQKSVGLYNPLRGSDVSMQCK